MPQTRFYIDYFEFLHLICWTTPNISTAIKYIHDLYFESKVEIFPQIV